MAGRFVSILKRGSALLLALFLAMPALSAAESPSGLPDTDLLLAGNAIRSFGVTGPDGGELVPRREPDMAGRGVPDHGLDEPDYVGVVGFATLPPSEKVSTFSGFSKTPWGTAAYEREGDKWAASGSVQHKTPVVVVDQVLRPGPDQRYRGYLQVIRLDYNEMLWLKVTQFVPMPYWTLPVTEAVKGGLCIAVYRNASRYDPKDGKARSGALPDGTHVLLCERGNSRYNTPDEEHNPLLGIVFPNGEKSETGTFLFFNPSDLTIVY